MTISRTYKFAFGAICIAFVTGVVNFSCKKRQSSKVLATQDFSAEDFNKLKAFTKDNCGQCHIDGAEGGFDFAGNFPKLAKSNLVVDGDPNASILWQRLADKSMPPTGADRFPNEQEKSIVS